MPLQSSSKDNGRSVESGIYSCNMSKKMSIDNAAIAYIHLTPQNQVVAFAEFSYCYHIHLVIKDIIIKPGL